MYSWSTFYSSSIEYFLYLKYIFALNRHFYIPFGLPALNSTFKNNSHMLTIFLIQLKTTFKALLQFELHAVCFFTQW